MAFLTPIPKHEYSFIDEEPEGNDEVACVNTDHQHRAISAGRLAVYALVLAILMGVLGFWVGNRFSHLDTTSLLEGNRRPNLSRLKVNG